MCWAVVSAEHRKGQLFNVQDRFDTQLGHELDVWRLWERAAKDGVRNHAAVVGRRHQRQQAHWTQVESQAGSGGARVWRR
jgi:hypothetical protein